METDKFLKSLIVIQSHIIGYLMRKKLNIQNFQLVNFEPYLE